MVHLNRQHGLRQPNWDTALVRGVFTVTAIGHGFEMNYHVIINGIDVEFVRSMTARSSRKRDRGRRSNSLEGDGQ